MLTPSQISTLESAKAAAQKCVDLFKVPIGELPVEYWNAFNRLSVLMTPALIVELIDAYFEDESLLDGYEREYTAHAQGFLAPDEGKQMEDNPYDETDSDSELGWGTGFLERAWQIKAETAEKNAADLAERLAFAQQLLAAKRSLTNEPWTPSDRDWTEDFIYENGNYENRCVGCSKTFRGHKRRCVCKRCNADLMRPIQEAAKDAAKGGDSKC